MTEPSDDQQRRANRPPRQPRVQETDGPRVVRWRRMQDMSAEERAFLARHNADLPPHHDSAWG